MQTPYTDRLQIVANIFAGRPNPLIELSDEELTALRERLDAARPHRLEPRQRREPPPLGYRGFLIFNPSREAGLPFRVEIFGGALAITDRPNEPGAADVARAELFSDSERIGAAISRPRFNATLLASFAGAALLLAAIGVYGMLSYSVSAQVHDIVFQHLN